MKILLFGVLADVVGKRFIETHYINNTKVLKQHLLKEFPSLNNYRFQLAVNKEIAKSNVSLNEQDEIALLPPFAGG